MRANIHTSATHTLQILSPLYCGHMCMKYAGCPILLWCQVKYLIGLEVSHTKSLSFGDSFWARPTSPLP